MLTILGSVLGFATSTVPTIMDFFKDKEEKKAKQEEFKLQIEAKKDFDEQKMLLEHDKALGQQGGFINSLRAFVRPFITYVFVLTFIGIKIVLVWQAIQMDADLNQTINIVWDDETEALFAAIISFWFGSRAMPARKK